MAQKKKPQAEETAKGDPKQGKAKRTKPAAKPQSKKAKEEAEPEQPAVVQEIQPEETATPVAAIQEPEKDYTLKDLLDAITVDSDDDDEVEILDVEDILGDDEDVENEDDDDDDEDFTFSPELQAKLDKADEVYEAGRIRTARLLEMLKMEREETEAYVNELLSGED